jgi:hypothetical protein
LVAFTSSSSSMVPSQKGRRSKRSHGVTNNLWWKDALETETSELSNPTNGCAIGNNRMQHKHAQIYSKNHRLQSDNKHTTQSRTQCPPKSPSLTRPDSPLARQWP